MSPGVILGIGLCLLIVGYVIRRVGRAFTGKAVGFDDLLKKVQTDANKDQIQGVIEFHKNRVKAGADGRDSFNRLVRDVQRIGGIEEEPEPSE